MSHGISPPFLFSVGFPPESPGTVASFGRGCRSAGRGAAEVTA